MHRDIPDYDFVAFRKVLDLVLEETMIHDSAMGKHNTGIALAFFPVVYMAGLPGAYSMFHACLLSFSTQLQYHPCSPDHILQVPPLRVTLKFITAIPEELVRLAHG